MRLEVRVIDYLARLHGELWWTEYAKMSCALAFVAGVELAAWGGRR